MKITLDLDPIALRALATAVAREVDLCGLVVAGIEPGDQEESTHIRAALLPIDTLLTAKVVELEEEEATEAAITDGYAAEDGHDRTRY